MQKDLHKQLKQLAPRQLCRQMWALWQRVNLQSWFLRKLPGNSGNWLATLPLNHSLKLNYGLTWHVKYLRVWARIFRYLALLVSSRPFEKDGGRNDRLLSFHRNEVEKKEQGTASLRVLQIRKSISLPPVPTNFTTLALNAKLGTWEGESTHTKIKVYAHFKMQ